MFLFFEKPNPKVNIIAKERKKNQITKVDTITVGSQIVAHTLTGIGNGPNRPNTINLGESGLKNWASSDFYNRYWGRDIWPRRPKHTNELGFFVRGLRFRWF